MDRRKLNAIVGYVARSLSAAALMIWGVFNIATLVNEFVRRTDDAGDWGASFAMCAVFGLLPFLIGSWMLYRNVAASSGESKISKTDQSK